MAKTCALRWFESVEQIAVCAWRGGDGDDRGPGHRVFVSLFGFFRIIVLALQFIFLFSVGHVLSSVVELSPTGV